jgi:hypothetical protein
MKSKPEHKIVSTGILDLQESLTSDRLTKLNKIAKPMESLPEAARPKESLIDLMTWAEKRFGFKLGGDINRFIHNKIIIDGLFLQFCEEKNITVEPLLKDSFVSWKNKDNEKFWQQGVFLIYGENIKFIHAALFHKGNQNEDEVSFFILVNNENYNAYIKFRNDYDEWAQKRDRANLNIRVIDGDDIPYERNAKWDDLFMPKLLKDNIRQSVEGFLASKHIYERRNIAWRRGIILYGQAGLGKTTCIKTIISSYDFKPITVIPSANDDTMRDAFAYAQEQNPSLLFFEDIDTLLQGINISLFLNLLDGISTKNGMLIVATTNSLETLKSNIKDRPSRFDRKFEIPLPNEEMSLKYIKKWFDKLLPDKDAKELAKYTVKYSFSYAYIKELYISSIYNAIANDREDPTSEDIKIALKQLMEDKFKKSGKVIGIDKYLGKKQ